ncbi:MAG: carboxypeptidase-like regulatory domain-containing protein [Melioribacteraceae bacterium]
MNIQILRLFLFVNLVSFIANISIVAQINSRTIVKGKVLDAKTNQPLQGVNVSILGTLKGAATNLNGDFIIKNVPNNSFYVVISYVGYETQKHLLRKLNGNTIKKVFALNEKIFKLDEITVNEKNDKEWKRSFKIFKKQFIGILNNSIFTNIVNPYIINFANSDDGWLEATSDEPIEIINDILGYKVIYYLDVFRHKYITTQYSGQPFFEEIKPTLSQPQNGIEEARVEAYCGSLRHFLYAATKQFNNEELFFLEEQGFKVYTTNLNPNPNKQNIKPISYLVNMNKFFSKGANDFELVLEFPNYLKIVYNREKEDPKYIEVTTGDRNDFSPTLQTSWINLPSGSTLLDNTGYYLNSFNIQAFGYWSYELLSSMLPYEYSLPDSILENYSLDDF